MDAKNLQRYVNEEVIHVIKKVDYLDIKGSQQQGFDCLILPTVCDLYYGEVTWWHFFGGALGIYLFWLILTIRKTIKVFQEWKEIENSKN